jgi:putative OPT family oligopeptide transporter
MSIQELTVRSVGLGLVLSAVMAAANVYLGLKVGMTVSASIPATVVGSLLLRSLFRGGTILEANQIQTSASAGESIAAGVIFTLPALVLIGAWSHFIWWQTTLIAFGGGLLGVLMMIPMRKVFIVEDKSLAFPEGVACAVVLKSAYSKSAEQSSGFGVILGTAIGAVIKMLDGLLGVITGHLETATQIAGRVYYIGSDISPALLGVGFIVRLNIAVLVFAGGAFGWLLCVPFLAINTSDSMSAVEKAWHIWDHQIRYIGVGGMVVGGVTSIVKVRRGLGAAFDHLRASFRRHGSHPFETEDISGKTIVVLSIVVSGIVAMLYYHFTHNALVTAICTVLMLGLSFFFTAVASYIVGLVGSSNSPVSGMTITALLISGGFITLLSRFTDISGMQAMGAMLGIAAIVCCVACTAGDTCNDLKTGQLVGASPRLQQISQIAGVAVGSLVMAPVLNLLHNHTEGGIGGRELAAPQATLFANLARGFFGGGHLPWDMVAIGVIVGTAVAILDAVLEARQARVRLHLMPLAVGIYLPFRVTIPMLIGAIIGKLAERRVGDASKNLERGMLLSSGFIAGEALMGIAVATLVALQAPKFQLIPRNSAWSVGLTLIAAAGVIEILRRHIRYDHRS